MKNINVDFNFNLETSREIMAEKMTNAVQRKYETHQTDMATAADAKRKQDLADIAAKFAREKEIAQMKIDADKAKNSNLRKDAIYKEKSIEFSNFEASRNTEGKNRLMEAVNANYMSNSEKNKMAPAIKKIFQEETQKEIQFIKNHVDPSLDVRHLDASEIQAEFNNSSRNTTGEFNTESNPPQAGYYRLVDEQVEDKKGVIKTIKVPVLISPGWQLDGNFLTNMIDYDRFALKGNLDGSKVLDK